MRSHTPLKVQARDNLDRFISQCRANLEPPRKYKFRVGGGRGEYRGQPGWNPRDYHGLAGRTRKVIPPGAALDVVLAGAALAEWDGRT